MTLRKSLKHSDLLPGYLPVENTIKIFGIGFSKTGTSTLACCLRKLGYTHLSWCEGLYPKVHAGHIETALKLANQFNSFDDWPWPSLYQTMDTMYPQSRFILTLRKDSKIWFDSLAAHSKRLGPSEEFKIIFGSPTPEQDKEHAIRVYEDHNRNVIDYFKSRPSKLLVVCWETGDEWEKLCRFLKQDVPSVPFPHEHKRPKSILIFRLKLFLISVFEKIYTRPV
jgi:sulfotransferase family protein